MGYAPVLEHCLYVGKVKVDERGIDDEFGNAPYTLLEYFVGNAQSFDHGGVLLHYRSYLVVGDDDESIDILFEIFKTLYGVLHPLSALEGERFGDDRNGEDLHIPCYFCNDGSRTRAGAAAHACRDEQQVGTLYQIGQYVLALFGGSSADIGVGACAETLGELAADLHLILAGRECKYLAVCIDDYVFGTADACFQHTVDGVVACAADAYDLNLGSARYVVYCLIVKHLLTSVNARK